MRSWGGGLLALVFSLASPGAAPAYEEVSVRDGGAIVGLVKFEGSPPPLRLITADKDRDVCGRRPIPDESLVLGKGGGIRWAVVSLADVRSGKRWDFPEPVLDQTGCVYTPHILLVKPGDRVTSLNSDYILHNVHGFPDDGQKAKGIRELNYAQPKFLKRLTLRPEFFGAPGIINMKCDLHAWMNAYIVVAENTYTAVTDENGRFTLTNVPPGSHRLEVWHESLGKASHMVTVEPNGTIQATVFMGTALPRPPVIARAPVLSPPPPVREAERRRESPAPPAAVVPPSDAVPPRIAINYPPDGLKTREEKTLLAGLVTDNEAVERVEVLVNGERLPGAPVTAGRSVPLSLSVPLRPGTNVIVLNAYDRAGNAGQAVRTVVREVAVAAVPAEAEWKSAGSGFLLRGTSHILTSLHVVEGAKTVRVSLPSGESFPGRVVAKDANNDLAVVELQGMPPRNEGFAVELGASVEVGEEIHAIGYPLGPGLSRRPSIVSGQVSADTGPRDNIAQFRMTAPINEGNSGGPLLNSKGILLGVASAGLVRQGVEAVRFGTKISTAALILGQAGLVQRFDIRVAPRRKASYTTQELFREFSPHVVLIETR